MSKTKRVRMNTIMSGPDDSYQPGDEVDFPTEKADELIAGGFAVEVAVEAKKAEKAEAKEVEEAKAPAKKAPKKKAKETATAPAAPEKAVGE